MNPTAAMESRSAPESALDEALANTRQALLQRLSPEGHWMGRLSPSALSTAVAVAGLSHMQLEDGLIAGGLGWLAEDQNSDGGWGDTPDSPSNLSTTLLCWAAFHHRPASAARHGTTIRQAEAFLSGRLGSLDPSQIATRVIAHYGSDRTFSVPILTLCALCGRLGPATRAWDHIPQLPFELAVLPHPLFRWLRLPVVSYAMPALIAIGLARHQNAPQKAHPLRRLRESLKPKVLRSLQAMQPSTGGFLEAVPLTGFVVMSLAASGLKDHPVAAACARFLRSSHRSDGSWPIDENLNTWLTSLSIEALAGSSGEAVPLDCRQRASIVRWLLEQQHRREHPFTHAAPGGWAWTDLAGGVPDADDTAGALVALGRLDAQSPEAQAAALDGTRWLLDLQNGDGGIPTFCRGWLNLPFDRSCPDITAHAVAAWSVWRERLPRETQSRLDRATVRALGFLRKAQHGNGSWQPLWFGSQHTPDCTNPLYGTARVLLGLRHISAASKRSMEPCLQRAQGWLVASQQPDGGWGATAEAPATVEETALALEALCATRPLTSPAISKGLRRLLWQTQHGTSFPPSPIGLYFSKLWYSEELYPIIFTHAALARAAGALSNEGLREGVDLEPSQPPHCGQS